MAESVRVFCRVRPMTASEAAHPAGAAECLHVHPSETSISIDMPDTEQRHTFTFAKIFNQFVSQRDVYEEAVKGVVCVR